MVVSNLEVTNCDLQFTLFDKSPGTNGRTLRHDSAASLAFCRNLLPLSQQPQDKNQ